jgi:DNA-binding response OmpR family regulator
VSVHVRRLREKIEVDPSDPQLVLTVPGIGYKLAT